MGKKVGKKASPAPNLETFPSIMLGFTFTICSLLTPHATFGPSVTTTTLVAVSIFLKIAFDTSTEFFEI